jgi:hypothetical protein
MKTEPPKPLKDSDTSTTPALFDSSPAPKPIETRLQQLHESCMANLARATKEAKEREAKEAKQADLPPA